MSSATVAAAAPEVIDPRTAGVLIEAKLRDWNLPYEYVADFPMADIRSVDWTQVRIGANVIDGDTVGEFRTHMSHGAVFPPIVLMDPNIRVDGNHRYAAAKGLRRKVIPAFVVKFASVDVARAFSAAVNQTNGRRLTAEEAARVATTMLGQGMADESIAREIGRSVTFVQSTRRRNEFSTRADRLPEIARLIRERPVSAKAQEKLAQVKHEPVFAEAVKLAVEARADPKVVAEIVETATSATSDADAISAIHAKRAELAPQGPAPQRVIVPQAVRNARMQLGGLLKFRENPPALLDAISDDARLKAAGQWQQLRDLAEEMLKLYGEFPRKHSVYAVTPELGQEG